MELRSFISTTLSDIIGGVSDAQKKCPVGSVVPRVASNFKSIEVGIHPIRIIDFEVSVSADEHSGTETKISVVAAVLGGSTQAGSNRAGGHVATLKFSVPVKFAEVE